MDYSRPTHDPATMIQDQKTTHLEALTEMARGCPGTELRDWPMFNEMTGGFRPKEFSILCGSTGSGKTTLLANMSAQLLKQKIKHFVMSVETGHTDYWKRVLSALDGRDLNSGAIVSPDVLMRLHGAHSDILEQNIVSLSKYANRCPVEQLLIDLRHAKDVLGCGIAFIDNLNFFMEVTSAANQVIEMDRVIHELIIFCKNVDMHLVMVMHPKKTEGDGRVVSEFDIKGSSTAVQEAHNVFLFNRPKQSDIDANQRHKFDRELTLKKMRRRGAFVGSTIVFESLMTQYHERTMK